MYEKLNIFGNGIQSVSPYITAQRRVNVYYDIRQDGDKDKLVICSTPGLTQIIELPNQPIRGMIQAGLYAYVVAGNQLFLISPSAGFTLLGGFGLQYASTPVGMAINETQLCIVDGQHGYVINIQNVNNTILLQTPLVIKELQMLFNIFNNVGA